MQISHFSEILKKFAHAGRFRKEFKMKKSISISIRVSEEELDKFKQAARLEAYASYSEFVRRTALIEAAKIIKKNENEGA